LTASSATASGNLAAHDCWELLRSVTLGRLAIVVDGRPEIFPVNFVVDHATIVFRSSAGTKTAGLRGDTSAAFEADGHGPDDATAWSVVIHGQLEPLVSFDPVSTDVLPLFPQQAGPKPQFIRVVPDAISGRQFAIVDPGSWETTPAVGRAQAWE
jgi:hypothetical protein